MTAPNWCSAISPICSRRKAQPAVQDYLESVKGAGVRQPARTGPRSAGARARRRPDPAVDDDGTDAGRRSEFLRGVSRPVAGQEERERIARGAAAGRSRRQRQGRHAGADQPRGPHAAQRHHRLCRSDDRRAFRRARQRALCRIHEGHPRLRRARDRDHQRPARSVAGSKPASSTSPSPTRTSTTWSSNASR